MHYLFFFLQKETWKCKRYGHYFNAALILKSPVTRGGKKPSPAFIFVSAVAGEEHPEADSDEGEGA